MTAAPFAAGPFADSPAAGSPTARCYIDGHWRTPSAAADGVPTLNPATEQPVARVADATAAELDDAVAAARAALPGWSALDVPARARFLRLLRRQMLAHRDDLAAAVTTEMGAPAAFSHRVQAGMPLRTLGGLLDALDAPAGTDRVGHSLVLREPVGVVGAITPWNYPVNQVVVKVAAALAVGCTVVLKPSEQAPLSAELLVRILDAVGLPPGVLNLVTGRGQVIGAALAAHPGVDMVSFTGGTAAGRSVAAAAAATVKRLALELGGKSAAVLLPDADLAVAVPAVIGSGLMNCGQTCTALSRLVVPAQRLEEVLDRAVAAMATYRIGDPTDPRTTLGPLATAAARDRALARAADAARSGRDWLDGSGGQPLPDRGHFVRPAVVAAPEPDAAVLREELFAPVVCVQPYADTDEALALANDSPYGLSGAVWSADQRTAVAFATGMRTGRVDVNGAGYNPAAPFGGRGQSGYGYELGAHGLAEFQVLKSIQLPTATAAPASPAAAVDRIAPG